MTNNALVAAECASLTGGRPDADGFARCDSVARVIHAAYVRTGLNLLAFGATWDALLLSLAQADFAAEGFHIEFRSLSKKDHGLPDKATVALANALPFFPHLDNPQHRFLLLVRDSGLYFGEIVTECQHSYKRHESKPYHTSASLPARLSRAVVNLVFPQARTLVDPCCGTGSILLEAQALGIPAFGSDQNEKMVEMARQNLAYFGYNARVDQADARTLLRTADALVTNLPYGRFLDAEESVIRAILERGVNLAPLAVYVAEHNIAPWLAAAGYADIQVYPVSKHHGFTRYVHVARRERL